MVVKFNGLEVVCHTESELMRTFLYGISLNKDLSTEERDALSYADSCIKTLVDMGVIK